jgi:hypothetical protein
MIKYYCDGCDKSLPQNYKETRGLSVEVKENGYCTAVVYCDLCSICRQHFLRFCNPERWPRQKKEPDETDPRNSPDS